MRQALFSGQMPALGDLDEQAFGALAEPHRRELQAHCYRMLGSVQDAEDMVQETFLRAWRRRETFEGRASFRAWLYRSATNLCLDALRRRPRRGLPVTRGAARSIDEPIPDDVNEPVWLEPFPDDLAANEEADPEARFTQRESITLAFVASLHLLPPRQRAVLILRDVLDWPASEVAVLLDQSVPSVKSALHRARTTLAARYRPEDLSPAALDESLRPQLERYVRAWETADVEGLTALLKADASFSMPPIPAWYQGPEAIGRLVAKTVFSGAASGRWRLQPARANGRRAFGLYKLNPPAGTYDLYGIQVVSFSGDQIRDITTFRKPELGGYFDLPAELPGSIEAT